MNISNVQYGICLKDVNVTNFPDITGIQTNLKAGSLLEIVHVHTRENYYLVHLIKINAKELIIEKIIYKCYFGFLQICSIDLYNYLLAVKNERRRLDIVENPKFVTFITKVKEGEIVRVPGWQFGRSNPIECMLRFIGKCQEIGPGIFFGFVITDPANAIRADRGLAHKYLNVYNCMGFIRAIDILLPRKSHNNNNSASNSINLRRYDNSDRLSSVGRLSAFSSIESLNQDIKNENLGSWRARGGNDNQRNRKTINNDKINFVPIAPLEQPIVTRNSEINFVSVPKNDMHLFRAPTLDNEIPPLMSLQIKASEQNEIEKLKQQIDALKLLVHGMKESKHKEGVRVSNERRQERKCRLQSCPFDENELNNIRWNKNGQVFTNSSYKTKCMICKELRINCLFSTYITTELKGFLSELKSNGFDISIQSNKTISNYSDENNLSIKKIKGFQTISQKTLLIRNRREAKCGQCSRKLSAMQGICIRACLHLFCKECLTAAVQNTDNPKVQCLSKKNGIQCLCELQDYEVKGFVDQVTYEEYNKRKTTNPGNLTEATSITLYCKGKDCHGWMIIDPKSNDKFFACPVCNKFNCSNCKAIHTGLTCKEYLATIGCNFDDTDGGYTALENEWVCSKCTKINTSNDIMCDICGDFRDRMSGSEVSDEYENLLETESDEDIEPDYFALLSLEDLGLVPNRKKFSCKICDDEFKRGEGVMLRECLHEFCKECLGLWIENCSDSIVKCPYPCDEFTCSGTLQEREVRELVSEDIFEKYLMRSVREASGQLENLFQCRTPNCEAFWTHDDLVLCHQCQICNAINCHNCLAIHTGLSCSDYQNKMAQDEKKRETENMLTEMLEKGSVMHCPNKQCRVLVERDEGCSYIKCTVCKTEICWATKGPRWGPNGNGDLSGGCRCDYKNGRKCHPDCNYCH